MNPEAMRLNRYQYYIAYIRNHLRYARLLRIDHVMAFHRLFWIPQGLEAAEGVYVHYNPEEFYAILTLESHRHRALIVGENLGTVPPYVNTMIAKHNILGMYVGQFSVRPDPPPAEVPPLTVASLNTHDTPTFAAFWEGADIEDRLLLGLLDEGGASAERQTRAVQKEALIALLRRRGHLGEATDTEAVLKAWLLELAQGPADLVLINLEDLWSESRPQNVPGTWNERPNWRRKARYRFEEFSTMAKILPTLKAVRDARC